MSIEEYSALISIPETIIKKDFVLYKIQIQAGPYTWKCFHRYRDFDELHERLVHHGLAKDLLPKKKVIGNQKPEFIEKRRQELEKYLQNVFEFLKTTMPREFVEFLHFDEYDAVFLLQKMAKQFATHMDTIAENKRYSFSMLEMHAISRRIGLPCHPLELTTNLYNFSHVLDFCSHLEAIIVVPTKYSKMDSLQCEELEDFGEITPNSQSPIGTSNIIPINLHFNFNAFRNVKNITLLGVPPNNVESLDPLRSHLESFQVLFVNVNNMSDILLCDDLHKATIPTEEKTFKSLKEINFCSVNLDSIDESITLVPNTETLSLPGNNIETIGHLQNLTKLLKLDLKRNRIVKCVDWHLRFGNIVTLNLAQNFIESLEGFRKLFCLVNLNLSCNQILDINEVDHLSKLPYLENLLLTGNPLSGEVDYRVRVLSRFKEKISDFYLDNEKAGQREIDTALILAALRQSKEIDHSLRIPTDLAFNS